MNNLQEICQWLRDNSSGIYRPAAEAAQELERMEQKIDSLIQERDLVRAQALKFGTLLSGIHALLYPPPRTDQKGRALDFRPDNPHAVLQALSDRIRALPDTMAVSGQVGH